MNCDCALHIGHVNLDFRCACKIGYWILTPGLVFIHSERFVSWQVACQLFKQGMQNLCPQSKVRFGVFSTQTGQGSVGFWFCFVFGWRFVGGEVLGIDGDGRGVVEIPFSAATTTAAVALSIAFSSFLCSYLSAAFAVDSTFPPTQTNFLVSKLLVFSKSECRLQVTNTQPLGYFATNSGSTLSEATSSHTGHDSANMVDGTEKCVSGRKREGVGSVDGRERFGRLVDGRSRLIVGWAGISEDEILVLVVKFPGWLRTNSKMPMVLKVLLLLFGSMIR